MESSTSALSTPLGSVSTLSLAEWVSAFCQLNATDSAAADFFRGVYRVVSGGINVSSRKRCEDVLNAQHLFSTIDQRFASVKSPVVRKNRQRSAVMNHRLRRGRNTTGPSCAAA